MITINSGYAQVYIKESKANSDKPIIVHCTDWHSYMAIWEKQSRHTRFREFFHHGTHTSIRRYTSVAHAKNAVRQCTGVGDTSMFEFIDMRGGKKC